MVFERAALPTALIDENLKLTMLFKKAINEISDEDYERIGRNAFLESFLEANASPAYKRYIASIRNVSEEG